MLRYLVLAMDVIGAALFVGGLCLLASLVDLFLVPVVAGAALIVTGAIVEMRGRKTT